MLRLFHRRSLHRIWHQASWWIVVLAVWFGPAAAAFAQRRRKEVEPPKEPSYALEYGVVIFVIMLGLAVVFRPGKRTDLEDEVKLPFGPHKKEMPS